MLAEFRAIAGNLFPRGQHALQLQHAAAALAGLDTLNESRDAAFYSSYTGGLLGPVCHGEFLDQLNAAIDSKPQLHPLIRRSLLDSRFETRRCLSMMETERNAR